MGEVVDDAVFEFPAGAQGFFGVEVDGDPVFARQRECRRVRALVGDADHAHQVILEKHLEHGDAAAPGAEDQHRLSARP